MSTVGRFSRRAPKSAQSRRAVRKMEAKVEENPKKTLFLSGLNTSDVVSTAMVDIRHLQQPNTKKLAKRNDFHPFTGVQHLEFLGFKNDCSLFAFGSHNKKRPNNLVLGRQHDFNVLDMIEFGIVAQDRLDLSRAAGQNCCSAGGRPLMVFEGSEFESEPFFIRLKNFFLDFFGGHVEPSLNLAGADRAIYISLRSKSGQDAVTAPSSDCHGTAPVEDFGDCVVCFRHYGVVQTSSTATVLTNASNVRLVDVGPNFDLEVRRVSWAAQSDFKRACRLPKQVLATLKHMHENVNTDGMGNLRGQLHVGSQDLKTLALRRFKAVKEGKRAGPVAPGAGKLTGNEAAGKAVYAGASEKAQRAAAEALAATEEGGRAGVVERVAKRRHRKAQPADALIGADVDI